MEALIPILLKIGAPALGKLVSGKFGPVAEGVVKTIAEKIGANPTPEAIEAAYEEDPVAVKEAVLEVERELASVHRQYLDGIDADRERGGLSALWRPINGVFFAVECLAVMLTVCLAILLKIPLDAALLPLIGLVGPVITAHAGVVGLYVHARSQEKKASVA